MRVEEREAAFCHRGVCCVVDCHGGRLRSCLILAGMREARLARIMRWQARMRSMALPLVICVTCSLGVGGRAFAEPAKPGATKVSTDARSRVVGAKPLGDAKRVLVEQKMGMRVPKPRKGDRLVAGVPELDPNAAGTALALLVSGALLFLDRRRSTRTDALLPSI